MGFRGRTKAEWQVAIDGVRFRYHCAAYIMYAIKRKYFIYFHSGGTADMIIRPEYREILGIFYFLQRRMKVVFILAGRWRELNLRRYLTIKTKI